MLKVNLGHPNAIKELEQLLRLDKKRSESLNEVTKKCTADIKVALLLTMIIEQSHVFLGSDK